jgi:MOSC domain-containing protein YiiM
VLLGNVGVVLGRASRVRLRGGGPIGSLALSPPRSAAAWYTRPVRLDEHLPPGDGSPLARSFAASLAAVLEVDPATVPVPDGDDPWSAWRSWLGTRGLGLVAVPEPVDAFAWPGPWIAVLPAGGGEEVAAVAFGAPPGIVWRPTGGDEPFDAGARGYLVAAHDVALWTPPRPADLPSVAGRVEVIAVTERAEGPMRVVDRAVARAGRGLEGDRYADGAGTFTNAAARGHDLTLIAAETLDALALPGGERIAYADARRNIVTRGIDLDALIGQRFVVGGVECLGQRRCEPCAHLERLTAPGALRGLVHRGGLRADVLTDGVVETGAPVSAIGPA